MRSIAGVLAAALVLGACGGDAETVGDGRSATDDVAEAGPACDGDLLVFFEPGTDVPKLDELAGELAGRDDVEAVAVWDQEETYEEFVDLFASTPEIVEAVTAEVLPPSVRVRAVSPDAKADVADSVEPVDAIREIVVDPLDRGRAGQPEGDGLPGRPVCNPDFPEGPQLTKPVDDDSRTSDSAAGWTGVDVPLSPRWGSTLVPDGAVLHVTGGFEPFRPPPECATASFGPDYEGPCRPTPIDVSDRAAFDVSEKRWLDDPPPPPDSATGRTVDTGDGPVAPPRPPFLNYDRTSWTGTAAVTTGWDYEAGERNGVGQFVAGRWSPGDGSWTVSAWPFDPPGVESTSSVAVGELVVASVWTDLCPGEATCDWLVTWNSETDEWAKLAEAADFASLFVLGDRAVLKRGAEIVLVDPRSGAIERLPPVELGEHAHLEVADGIVMASDDEELAILRSDRTAWERHGLPTSNGRVVIVDGRVVWFVDSTDEDQPPRLFVLDAEIR